MPRPRTVDDASRASRRRRIGTVVVLVVAAMLASGCADSSAADGGSSAATTSTPSTTVAPDTSTSTSIATTTTTMPPPAFPTFAPSEYGRFVDSLGVPDAAVPATAPSITGDPAADAHIRELAEARGYRLRPVSGATMPSAEGVLVHPAVVGDLEAMLAEARFFGLTVGVSSGYRSVGRQREIFDQELAEESQARIGRRYTSAEVASGAADEALEAVLSFNSVPGYSRHHSGIVVDLDAGGELTEFEGSPVEQWLRADDFANAKRFGFVPSYPRGGDPQGPEPEPWEFVHVGPGAIRCAALYVPLADPDAARSCA